MLILLGIITVSLIPSVISQRDESPPHEGSYLTNKDLQPSLDIYSPEWQASSTHNQTNLDYTHQHTSQDTIQTHQDSIHLNPEPITTNQSIGGWGITGIIISAAATIAILLALATSLFFSKDRDLLQIHWIRRLLLSRWYPTIIQAPTMFFFIFIIYYFFFGVQEYSQNPGSILAWTLWWPLIPITFLLLGRVWCVACPIPLLGDWIQKWFGKNKRVPAFLQKYGIWITDGMFIAITLFDRLYGMVDRPILSGAVFVVLLFGATSLAVMYERRAFCRYMCFLGGVSGNYSMLAGAELVTKNRELCLRCLEKYCYKGTDKVPGCPLYNVMSSKDSSRNCTLCANCLKACPHDNISLRLRPIGSELWRHATVRFQESFFAKLLVGVVIVQNLGMLTIWPTLIGSLGQLGLSPHGAIAVIYSAAIALPLAFMTLSSKLSNFLQTTPTSTWENFAAYGYAFIPIDVSGHIAHNLFHLLAEGRSIIGAFLGLISGRVVTEGALTNPEVIRGAQLGLILIGAAGTLLTAFMIARKREPQSLPAALKVLIPHAGLLIILILVNLALFSSSMIHRGH